MRWYELHATTEPTSWPISVGPRVVWRLCWSLAQGCSKFNFLWEIFSKPIFFAGKMSKYRSIMSISPRKMRCDRTKKCLGRHGPVLGITQQHPVPSPSVSRLSCKASSKDLRRIPMKARPEWRCWRGNTGNTAIFDLGKSLWNTSKKMQKD